MKKTGPLRVSGSTAIQAGRFHIHPNEGFDLGLMTTAYRVNLVTGVDLQHFAQGEGETQPATVWLLNECPQQTLQLNFKQWEIFGKPEKAMLLYEGDRLYLQRV